MRVVSTKVHGYTTVTCTLTPLYRCASREESVILDRGRMVTVLISIPPSSKLDSLVFIIYQTGNVLLILKTFD